jgi:hypothetical protein
MCKRKPISPRRRQMPRTNPISPARGRVTEAKYAKRTQFRAGGWRPAAIVRNEPNFA